MKKIQSLRGMNDYLLLELQFWRRVEEIFKRILNSYNFNEIRTPIVENTSLFFRAIGKESEIARKEMYNFCDRDGNHISLRPENTASCVRAGIENKIFNKKMEHRFYYYGPFFRYERPQKARYRQFYQFGVEVFGSSNPEIEVELIFIILKFFRQLGIESEVLLELNTIGSFLDRENYKRVLIDFFYKNKNLLGKEYFNLVLKNPLRIFESKDLNLLKLSSSAPYLDDYIDNFSKVHFRKLCNLLDKFKIKYFINKRLIRGLDYYNQTVFEWTTNRLGSQNAICAGGRYDFLVEKLGGKKTSAVGFAIGMERLILLIKLLNPNFFLNYIPVDIYLITDQKILKEDILFFSEEIREYFPNLRLSVDSFSGSIKKQLVRANKCKAKIALIIRENEFFLDKIIVKNLRKNFQKVVNRKDIYNIINSFLKN